MYCGFAARMQNVLQDVVLSVEFLDGDVLGGIPVRSCDNHCYVALAVNASADVCAGGLWRVDAAAPRAVR